ncbi:hypothetical protein SBDP1_480031 [Syntrophobacter sp. SbD1]|nr:hypothetical protein SBDP1_480031 [Syntrophobacter sp. SbD1]
MLSLISTFIAINGSPLDLHANQPYRNPARIYSGKKQMGRKLLSSPWNSLHLIEQLELLYPDRRWSFGALLNFETYTIAFLQAFEAGGFNGAMVNKNIFSATLNRDKSEALLIVEPLHSTLRHSFSNPSILCWFGPFPRL